METASDEIYGQNSAKVNYKFVNNVLWLLYEKESNDLSIAIIIFHGFGRYACYP
jgi:hypothetical protein